MSQKHNDKALALLAAKGDGEAFRQLLERHYDTIFRVAYRYCGHREEAEDIAQDVCVSLPARLKTYRGEAAFLTWLYRVVVNRAKDMLRKNAVAGRKVSEFAEVDALRRGEEADTNRKLEWLEEMMARLSDDLRETAILVVGEGMNHSEAAELLGVKEGTVSWRVSELKKALREFAKEEA